jgi:hypothetical protein
MNQTAMMDPFSALVLASNIIDFVDFTWNLVSGTREVYKSLEGSSESVRLLDTISEDIRSYNHAITASVPISPSLQKLIEDCTEVGNDLQKALNNLKVQGKQTKWASFVVALKGVWRQDEVDKLYNRVARLQGRIAEHILSMTQ